MAVLVTGGTGFIGSHTCVELINSGYEVVIIDDLSNSKEEVCDSIEKITGKRPAFIKGDLVEMEPLEKAFNEHKIDAVIHFAGLKAVGESVAQPIRYYKTNLNSTINTLNAMQKYNCKRIVFSSSATVYRAGNSMPLKEGMELGASNPYGETKVIIEDLLRDVCHTDKDFSAVLLRYFNPVGAHSSGLIGENPNGIPNNLMPYIISVAMGRLPHLNVFGSDYPTPDGTGVRDYIHVCDLAKGHISALKYSENNKGANAFNLGTGNGTSVLEMVAAFEKATGINIPVNITDRRPGDLPTSYADATLAKNVLGWQAELTIEDMMRDSWTFAKTTLSAE